MWYFLGNSGEKEAQEKIIVLRLKGQIHACQINLQCLHDNCQKLVGQALY